MADYSDEDDFDDEDEDFGHEPQGRNMQFATNQEEDEHYQYLLRQSNNYRTRNYGEAGSSYSTSSGVTPFPRF